MSECEAELMRCTLLLANALWRHRGDWDEQSSETYNRQREAELEAALNEARRLGWRPT